MLSLSCLTNKPTKCRWTKRKVTLFCWWSHNFSFSNSLIFSSMRYSRVRLFTVSFASAFVFGRYSAVSEHRVQLFGASWHQSSMALLCSVSLFVVVLSCFCSLLTSPLLQLLKAATRMPSCSTEGVMLLYLAGKVIHRLFLLL